MNESALLSLLVSEESFLDKKRTNALARQQWAKVIEYDAKKEQCRRLRTEIAKQAEQI
jgi:hypothetical protein